MQQAPSSPRVEFLWFDACPNHEPARELLLSVLEARGLRDALVDIDATEPRAAGEHCFAGSPTIRVDGKDIEPGFVDSGDYTPRCRVYWTEEGLKGLPPREMIEVALDAYARS